MVLNMSSCVRTVPALSVNWFGIWLVHGNVEVFPSCWDFLVLAAINLLCPAAWMKFTRHKAIFLVTWFRAQPASTEGLIHQHVHFGQILCSLCCSVKGCSMLKWLTQLNVRSETLSLGVSECTHYCVHVCQQEIRGKHLHWHSVTY